MKILHHVGTNKTLEQISQKYHCNVFELMKVNDLQSENLHNISELFIPSNESNFIVLKNFDKELLVEVNEQNVQDLKNLANKQTVVCSCQNVENLEAGDKVIVSKQQKFHVVKPLETLSVIANKLNLTEQELIKKNNLKTNKVFIGQKIMF